jgi:SAM-dependent methyltransferase
VRDYLDGVTHEDLLMGLPLSFKIRHPRRTVAVAMPHWLGKLFKVLPEELQERFLSFSKKVSAGPALSHVRTKFFESLQRDIVKLNLHTGASRWAKYYGTANEHYFHTDLSPVDWQKKREALERIMGQVSAASVLDVGANTGLYAELASSRGARVVACETDVPALSQCYARARGAQLNILPLVVNVFCDSPSPGRGGIALPAPTERLRSDLAMALALVHHVIAIQRVSIARIVEIMAALSARWLLLEYVPPLKSKMGASPVSGLDDYTSETLENCLRAHFKSIRRFPSYPEPRELFLCEK